MPLNWALVAGPPSPLNPFLAAGDRRDLPALGSILRTLWLSVSAR